MPTIIQLASGNSLVVKEDVAEVRGKLTSPDADGVEFTQDKLDESVYVNPSNVEYVRNQPPRKPPAMPRTGR